MQRLILGRLMFMGIGGLVIVSLAFALFHWVPGDPARLIAGDNAPLKVIEAIRESYGFNQPLTVQFYKYLSKLVHGDLGTSLFNKESVLRLIIPRFINTAKLAGLSTLFAIFISLILGCLSAIWFRSNLDKLVTVVSLLGICTPVFVSGLLALQVFSVHYNLLPVGYQGTWQSYILPIFSIGIYSTAFFTRMIRVCMVEALRDDWITTARAKGVGEFKVVFHHALRNALIPIVTVIGLRFGHILGGTVITEMIFTWPGLGRLMVNSILTRDLPVTQGSLLIFAITFIIINFVVDVSYIVINPRIKYT